VEFGGCPIPERSYLWCAATDNVFTQSNGDDERMSSCGKPHVPDVLQLAGGSSHGPPGGNPESYMFAIKKESIEVGAQSCRASGASGPTPAGEKAHNIATDTSNKSRKTRSRSIELQEAGR
jgi:hypothetical protein